MNAQDLDNWIVSEQELKKTFEFKTFEEAIAFVNSVAAIAQAHNHHPDIDIRYNKVTLVTTSHDAGSKVTDKDVALAKAVDGL